MKQSLVIYTEFTGIVQPLMMDGITLGRPQCAVDTCREDLAKNRDIFCPTHFGHHFKCAVRACPEPPIVGKMCTNPQHQKMESLKKARSNAPFQLAKWMQRVHVSHPNDALLSEDATSDNHNVTDDLEGNIEWFELEGETEEHVRMYNEANPGGIGEEDVPNAVKDAGESQWHLNVKDGSAQPLHIRTPDQRHHRDCGKTKVEQGRI